MGRSITVKVGGIKTELNHIYNGDSLEILKMLPSDSIDCCVTSPPYYGLRDYGVDGQIGLEENPEQFIEKLVCVFNEVKRVLKPEGTLWVNMGDSYVGTGGDRKKPVSNEIFNMLQDNNPKDGRYSRIQSMKNSGLKPKDLIGIPWTLAFALRDEVGYYLRNDIVWSKPNPMPESVSDRCTKSHEYIFLLSKSDRYYYDAEAISEPVADSTVQRLSQDIESQIGSERVQGKSNGNMKAAAPRYGGINILEILIHSIEPSQETHTLSEKRETSVMYGQYRQNHSKKHISLHFHRI